MMYDPQTNRIIRFDPDEELPGSENGEPVLVNRRDED
mgnify:FL=1